MTDNIRKATKDDLSVVNGWLRAEREETGGGFFCNWSIINRSFQCGRLNVLAVDGDVVGFVADAINGPAILEVRPDARSKGYGRQLAGAAITAAFARDISVLEIDCVSETSVLFWEKMGFTASRNQIGIGGGVYAHRVLRRSLPLADGPRAHFEIGFYPEERVDRLDAQPFRTYAGEGLLLEDGSLRLPERAICFRAEMVNRFDCVVKVAANGALLFADEVKSPKAKAFGVSRDAGGIYYIDKIFRLDVQ